MINPWRRTVLLLLIAALSGTFERAWASPGATSILSVQKDSDGITLRMNRGVLRLQVCGPDVIRVVFAPGPTLPATQSLAVNGKQVRSHWSLSQTSSELYLRTDRVEVRVNRATGAIRFFDRSERLMLAETSNGGKTLARNRVGSVDTFRSEQSFVLPSDEALYGLGQHQEGGMNYRGQSIKLQQENREVAIPLLVSSRGYGVLWDNPAVTFVNAGANPEETIPAAQLFTEENQPGRLTARYFRGEAFEELIATRTDTASDFKWSETTPAGVPHDHYSVRWSGFLNAEEGGTYRLSTTTDNGVRVWIDDQLVLDDWSSNAARTDHADLNFAPNSRHRIRVDYLQNTDGAQMQLRWRVPSEAKKLTWKSEAANSIDYYFLYGPELDQVIAAYRRLTGSTPMLGKWAWGLWQCKERYQSQGELLDVVSHYRRLHIPLDGIIQDWQYWTPHPWGSHQFDARRYPDPKKLIADLHGENVHVLISVWPKFDLDSGNAKELREAGALYPQVVPHVDPVGGGQWYDPFNPSGRRIYWNQLSRELFSKGIDGWWLDASEPELAVKWGEFRDYSTAAGPGLRVYNAYPLMHTTAVYEGQRTESSANRVFILTRSAYAGQQRNSAVTWSGDIDGTWDVLAKQIPAGLNFSLSGIPYWSTDTGGFFGGDPATPSYAELFTRWFQFSVFCPMLRIHGTNYPKEFWRFDEATQKTLTDYDELRYHLLPYIYSVSWQVSSENYTMMRGLVMDFRADPKVYNLADQYMFGPALMVAPIVRPGAQSRSLYLPTGTNWVDFWTGKVYAGGQALDVPAPVATIPIFVRAGSILPYGPSVQYAMEKNDPIELRIYPGADGGFTVYEDEGDNYDYEKGQYATIPISWTESTRTLLIGDRRGTYPGMAGLHTFHIVWVSQDHGSGTSLTEKPDRVIDYRGKAVRIRLAN